VTLAIGDVSGKGVPAALLMASLQATFRAELASGGSPSEITGRVNRRLCALESPTRIVSFFCGRLCLERGRLSYTNAGHLHPMLVRRDGQVERLDRGGLILGILDDVRYEGAEVHLGPGDIVVFFTDGVIERGGPEELFGEADLLAIAERHRHLSAADLMGRILEALEHRTGTTPDDDTTLMVLKAL
jgi:sigma-B regulation protein RsbU (phosphoserine phosphatase)